MSITLKKNSLFVKDGDEYIDAGIYSAPDDVAKWLEAHPEVTTSVQDGSISENKLTSDLKNKTITRLDNEISRSTSVDSTHANQINALSSRMDTFTHLADGTTTGDAELIDARVGYDGTTYANAGTAIREQVSKINSAFEVASFANSGDFIYKRIFTQTGKNATLWYQNIPISVENGFSIFVSNVQNAMTEPTMRVRIRYNTNREVYFLVNAEEWTYIELDKTLILTAIDFVFIRATSEAETAITSAWDVYVIDGKTNNYEINELKTEVLENTKVLGRDVLGRSISFSMDSGTTHSSLLDRLKVNISKGEKYIISIQADVSVWCEIYEIDSESNHIKATSVRTNTENVLTASLDIALIGITVASVPTATEVNVYVTSESTLKYQLLQLSNDVADLQTNLQKNENGNAYTFSFSSDGSVHSSSNDGFEINIAKNVSFELMTSLDIEPSGTFQCWAIFNDDTSGLLLTGYFGQKYVITAPNNITKIGITIGVQRQTYICTVAIDINSEVGIEYLNKDSYDKLLQAKRTINLSSYAYLSNVQPLVLLHFSDIHGSTENMRRIVSYRDSVIDKIDDCICTGDMVTDRYNNGMSFWDSVKGSENILTIIGNHDVLAGDSGYDWTNLVSQQEQYSRYIAPYVDNWDCEYTTNLTYYYKDYASKQVRLICLNCMLLGNDATAQLSWLNDVLNDAFAKDYYVIIATHYTISNHTIVPCNFSSLDRIPNQTSSTLDDTYMSAVNDFIIKGGKFVCYIAGHTHSDYILKANNYRNQLCLVIDAAGLDAANAWSDTHRTAGTKSQDCANLFVFDGASGVIKIIRVGADTDHYLRIKKCITISLSDNSVLTEN